MCSSSLFQQEKPVKSSMLFRSRCTQTPKLTRGGYLGVFLAKRDADAPTLPVDGPWSSEFREFLGLCLEKNPARRLGCSALMETTFIQRAAATWKPGTRRLVPNEKEERKEGREKRLSWIWLVPRGYLEVSHPFCSGARLPGAPMRSDGMLARAPSTRLSNLFHRGETEALSYKRNTHHHRLIWSFMPNTCAARAGLQNTILPTETVIAAQMSYQGGIRTNGGSRS